MMMFRQNIAGDEIRFSNDRSPYIDRERIKLLRIYKKETEKIISKLKKEGCLESIHLNSEIQLLNSINAEIEARIENNIRTEFNKYDYLR